MNSNISQLRRTMDDHRETIEKLNQYKSLMKLCERNKKLRRVEARTAAKKVSKELKTLFAEVKHYRKILEEVQCGDKRRMHNNLQHHRDLQLAYEDRTPLFAHDAIFEKNSLFRKQLNELYFLKRNKIKEFFDYRLEWTLLMNQLDEQNRVQDADANQQKITVIYYERVASRNTAEMIRVTYQSILDILQKDRGYYNALLEALAADRLEQGQVLLRLTYMGQIAAEDLDDSRQRYETLSQEIWKNAKEREDDLKVVRKQVDSLWQNVRLLARVESDIWIMDGFGNLAPSAENELEKQINSLEDTLSQVKVVLLARSHDELLSRLEEHASQRKRLITRLEASLETRQSLMNKKNSALVILDELKNAMIAAVGPYENSKQELVEQLEEEKERAAEFIKQREAQGELLIEIKSALQNMLVMMICIRPGWGVVKKLLKEKKTREVRKRNDLRKEKKTQMEKQQGISNNQYELEKFNSDVLVLLDEVTKKAKILAGLSNFELMPKEIEKAKNLYQSYVAEFRSNVELEYQKSKLNNVSFEPEVLDESVPTRAAIKSHSKRIIEAQNIFN